MNALTKLQDLYNQRDNITKQIDAIGEILGAKTEEKPKQERKKRGPNKPKEAPPEPVKLKEVPPRLPNAVI
jgi:hypothetical protein